MIDWGEEGSPWRNLFEKQNYLRRLSSTDVNRKY